MIKLKSYSTITIIIAILLLVFLIPVHIKLSHYAFDDAYIHLRIADNLANNNAPFFNPGERIMASTSPGWTTFLAVLLKLLPFSMELLSIVNALFCVAGAVIFTQLVQFASGQVFSPGKFGFFMVLYICLLFQSSVGLMEIPCTLLLLGLGLKFLVQKKEVGFTFLALIIFFRPEMAIFYIFALLFAFKNQVVSLKSLLGYTLIGLLPFVIYDLTFFHTLIPNTIMAKSKVYEISRLHPLSTVASSFLPDLSLFNTFISIPLIFKVGYFYIWLFFLVIVILKSGQKVYLKNDNNNLILLVLIPGITIAGLYIAARALIFSWYMPLYTVPILFGIFGSLFAKKIKGARWIFLFISLPLLALLFLGVFQNAWAAFNDLSLNQNFEQGARVRKYLEVGRELYEKYPDATLLSSEIGGLGWGFKGYIMDGVGLITPQALKYHPMRVPEERSMGVYGSIPAGLVTELRPDIIVSYDVFIEDLLKRSVLQEYNHYREPVFIEQDMFFSPEGTVFGSQYLNIFIRKDFVGTNREQ
ncbi:MAG: hypothetical protein JXA42_01755 [Anaerolineales bacterium]|nr:hypothetical protein [Anaerolineales bacterium]